ncbi:hypothetical protein QHH03_29620, partial [Aphanizomenon sp. 202]|nr:hypothetical protein [Aphanizomenon sp. 202]
KAEPSRIHSQSETGNEMKYFLPHPNPLRCFGEGTGFLLLPPFIRGKGGNNVMKITGYDFSNILLEVC